MNQTRQFLFAAVAILIVAAFLRFHSLEVQSFWNDEGNSARLSERSIPAILEGTASDIHPPLYYLILRGWRELAGDTEFGLRSFSTFAGILTVAVTIAFGRLIGLGRSPLIPLLAGLLAAISPVMVYYSQETRMYMFLALMAAASTWALVIWMNRWWNGKSSHWWATAYVLCLTAGLYTHYSFPAVMVAQFIIVVVSFIWPHILLVFGKGGDPPAPSPKVLRGVITWVGMATIASLLYLPWLPVFFRQVGGRPGDAGDVISFLVDSGRWLWLGSTIRAGEADWAILAGVILAGIGVAAGGRRALLPLIMVLLPLISMALVGATDPAYFKFLLVIVPFIGLLMALSWLWTGWKRWGLVVLTLVVLIGSSRSLLNMYTDAGFARADYRGMAQRITNGGHPDAGIILNAPNQWEAFTYYYRDIDNVYPLPRSRPDPAIVEPELARIASDHDRLYALFWGDVQRDPERIIEKWLDSHTFKASEEWVGDVRFVVYAVPHEATFELLPSEAQFQTPAGTVIYLLEYGVWPSEARPGDVVQVKAVWQPETTPEQPYKVFLHVLNREGQLVAQRDGEPVGGARPTTTWLPGEQIEDNHGLLLPVDLPPGRYTIRMGLYDALDPTVRLLVTVDGSEADGVTIGTIDIP